MSAQDSTASEEPLASLSSESKTQQPGETAKEYARRLGYGPNDFGAPGYDPTQRDTTWDGYSIGDRYADH